MDISQRVDVLEKDVKDIRERVIKIEAAVPHLATKADLIATKADLMGEMGSLKAGISAFESTIIKWFVATAFAMTGVGAAITFGLVRLIK